MLKTVSSTIRNSIRKQDAVARWGGEEFILLLPETNLDGALIVADKLREKIEKTKINYDGKMLNF